MKKIIELDNTNDSETCKLLKIVIEQPTLHLLRNGGSFCSKNNLNLEKILSSIRQRKLIIIL